MSVFLRRSVYSCLCHMVYVCMLIHLHSLFARGESARGPQAAQIFCADQQKTRSAGYPYTETKAYVHRHSAFLARAISPRNLPSSSAMENSLVRQVNNIPSGRCYTSQSSGKILTQAMISYQRPNMHFYDSRLYSTTSEADELSAITDDAPRRTKDTKKNIKTKKKSTDPLEVVVLGLSHHHAKVEVREKVAIPEADWNAAAEALCAFPSIQEAAPLSTCNRFEMYLAGENQYEVMRDAMKFLEERSGGALDQKTLRSNTFVLSGEDAIWHLLKVSAGLDSLIVGEGQILAQVKRCYEHGIDKDGRAGKVISRMLNTAVSAGKRVRSETGISKGAVSISSAAAEFTSMCVMKDLGIDNIADANICILGAGKMARLLLVHLQTQGVTKVHIVNRSPERVVALREEFPDMQIDLSMLNDMWNVIRESDVVYPATYSETTIVNTAELEECMNKRTVSNGIQFVDISVPRNVHADCGDIDGVFSYNVDDLKAVVERNTAKRRKEMVEAEVILREELGKYVLWQQSLGAIPTIAKLQEKAEKMRQEELSKVSKKLNNLDAKDLETVERLSKGIVNKLLHGPMNHLRQQKTADDTRATIQQVRDAFQLEDLSSAADI